MSAITVSGLQKSFSASRVLSDISIEVQPGEMVALVGSSGSGKSTLMRHLSGLTLADSDSDSRVEMLGQNVQQRGRAATDIRQTRARIGTIFQQFNLVNRLSVQTNVLIGALSRVPVWRSLTGWFTQQEKRQALEALEQVGLREHALKRASELSGGQQQRVAIARALMQQAEVILADEPIASLDPESSRQVMDTLQRINRELGITVVVTLHQVDYAQKYCRRAIALRRGEIFFDGPIEGLDNPMLAELYGTRLSENGPFDAVTEWPQASSHLGLNPV
ncbi:phosphonate ABC transporter ATP-binding protein [Aestuariirhabdus sp. Z084]|uniref:phosphonate ABC transporter ATP-binding protein n=1 Tax=Aestuariirhabdus haliotis TaxID=2918751 RepID=UPI00201B35AE|nr:phosphonate ABC transporter ATP-binding protein [Aestuariirhabdus haliotis]MCL6416011.1 phosphonate ABC transporter ATP-binding protein [Aestuariirhabdus haliotis]MCL6419956.1 phosphonate ABC transporter ATP-binding protein [Aestuariirhabdus haliotis]